jgi:hypothetical protein
MSCRLCHFPSCQGENIWEKFYVLEFAAKLLGGPPCYPIDSLVEPLNPSGLLFQLRYSFQTLERLIRGPQRRINIFVRPSNMFWSRSFCNNIGKCYTVVSKYSLIIIISPIRVHLDCWKNCNCYYSSSEKQLRNPKTSRDS